MQMSTFYLGYLFFLHAVNIMRGEPEVSQKVLTLICISLKRNNNPRMTSRHIGNCLFSAIEWGDTFYNESILLNLSFSGGH